MLDVRQIRLRWWVLGFFVVLAAGWWNPSAAQQRIFVQPVPGMNGLEEQVEDGPAFVTNREIARRLTHAKKLLANEDYQNAVRYLQSVLDEREDWFVEHRNPPQPGKNPNNPEEERSEETGHFESLKNATEKLIGEMPAEGQRVYDQEYGTSAKQMLEEAVKSADAGKLNEIARRFFHTEAGYEAVYRLGLISADHGEPFAAALQLQRLKSLPKIAKRFEPMLSLKLALCWEQAGLPENSVAVLKQLKRESPNSRIRIGRRELALFEDEGDARQWLAATLGQYGNAMDEAEQWSIFRGNPGRNAHSSKASPVGPLAWSRETIADEDPFGLSQDQRLKLEQEVQSLTEDRKEEEELLPVPAAQPLIVNNLAIYRTLQNVQAVDVRTGEVRWKSAQSDPVLRPVLSYTNPQVDQFGQPVGNRQRKPPASALEKFLTQRLWRDMTFGTLSSDSQHVYSVENLGMADGMNFAINGQDDPLMPQTHNKLVAFGLGSGLAKWEAGGPRVNKEDPIGGTFFLGAPLPLGQQLYCLGERNNEVSLMVLQASTGKLIWEQRLLSPAMNLMMNRQRRMTGLSPTFGQGVMVCPTASGAVVAVDVSRRMLLWAYRYESDQTEDTMVSNPVMRGRNVEFLQEVLHPESCWADSVPVVAQGRVLLTPNDSQELHCLDLETGQLQWSLPREDGIYLAGVHKGSAIIVGRKQVQAVQLTDGKETWDSPLSIPVPAGRGYLAESTYHLPLSTGEIATIDLKKGRMVAKSRLPEKQNIGNLVSAGGRVVFQSQDSVGVFYSMEQLNADIQRKLNQDGERAEALALRGTLHLHRGEEDKALDDLRQSWDLEPSEPARSLLVTTLLEGLRRDFKQHRDQLEELRQLLRTPEERMQFLQITAQSADDGPSRSLAMEEYLKLACSFRKKPELKKSSSMHSVRSDRWIKARIEELLAKAPPEERKPWDQLAAQELAAAWKDCPDEAKWYVLASLPPLPAVEAAELEFVRNTGEDEHIIRKEMRLWRLRKSSQEKIATQATLALAELYMALGREAEVFPLIGELGENWPKEWQEDFKDLKPPEPVTWPNRKLKAKREPRNVAVLPETPVEVVSVHDSPFANWTFSIDQQTRRLLARDENGRARWHFDLSETSGPILGYAGITLHLHRHLAVLSLNTHFAVLDLLSRQHSATVLWSEDLTDGSLEPEVFFRMQRFRQNQIGGGQVPGVDVEFGAVGFVNNQAVVYQVGERLAAADPITGEPLWIREDLHDRFLGNSRLFGDGKHLVIVSPAGNLVRILRLADGSDVRTLNLKADEFLTIQGTEVIEQTSAENKPVLESRNLLDDQVLWRIPYPEGTQHELIGDSELALLHPEGTFEVVSLEDGKSQIKVSIEAEKDRLSFWVLRRADAYVLGLSRESNPPGAGQFPQFPQHMSAQVLPVNGPVYAFDRRTGKQLWMTEIKDRTVEALPPYHSPVMVFNKRLPAPQAIGGRGANNLAMQILDLRNGEIIFEHNRLQNLRNIFPLSITVHPEKKAVTVMFYESEIEIELTEEPIEHSQS